ncbi:MAG: tetratricopeptide repeat protein, partial [Ottowia sp.]|nr:tetratricopeptide repeat protein [Ottowia sp.]
MLGMRMADKAGNPAAAIQAARKALELSPDWHVTLVELAKLLAEQDQRDEAMKLIRRAIDMEPFDTDVRVAAINVAARAGQPDQALTWARQGVQNHPDHLGMQLYL